MFVGLIMKMVFILFIQNIKVHIKSADEASKGRQRAPDDNPRLANRDGSRPRAAESSKVR